MSLHDSKNLKRLAARLFPQGDEAAKFISCLIEGRSKSPALVWLAKPQAIKDVPYQSLPRLNFQADFVERFAPGALLGQSEAHKQGLFYLLDFSAVFETAPLRELALQPELVVDLCASPGGKSVLAQGYFPKARKVANEVIKSRLPALRANFSRLGLSIEVQSRDSSVLAEVYAKSVDLCLVDAPCSGQSLLARGVKAEGCFHPLTLKKNAGRQKRILLNAVKMLGESGYLLYSTCTFSPEENEEVVSFLLEKCPELQAVEVQSLSDFRSPLADFPAYRLYPQQGLGAGGFCCLLQRAV